MFKTIQYCDVCQMEIERESKLTLIKTATGEEQKIDCLCDACVDAINAALEARQHVTGVKAIPYKAGVKYPYQLDEDGRKVPVKKKDRSLEYIKMENENVED